MDIYCAGKTQDWPKVRMIQRLVRDAGHTVSHDWTKIVEANQGDVNEVPIHPAKKAEYAEQDMHGVFTSDMTIALGNPNLCGTLWECGMTIAFGHPLWVVQWGRNARASVFDFHRLVRHVATTELGDLLWKLSNGDPDFAPRLVVLGDGNFSVMRHTPADA